MAARTSLSEAGSSFFPAVSMLESEWDYSTGSSKHTCANLLSPEFCPGWGHLPPKGHPTEGRMISRPRALNVFPLIIPYPPCCTWAAWECSKEALGECLLS